MATITQEWMQKWESIKNQMDYKGDLESYFREKTIMGGAVDTISIGTVNLPTGTLVAADPTCDFSDQLPYMQTVPAGTYPVTICVIMPENRNACLKISISDARPVRYELGMQGVEDLDVDFSLGGIFGFPCDASMGGIFDIKTQEAANEYAAKSGKEIQSDITLCLRKNAEENQDRPGDWWLNYMVPGTKFNIPMSATGWGDGTYPCYFGYDQDGNVCAVYALFIDLFYTESEE